MSNQDYKATILGTDNKVTTLTSVIPQNFDIVRSRFDGTAAPLSPVLGQLWADSTTGTTKVWNGSAWAVLGPRSTYERVKATMRLTSVSATGTGLILAPLAAFTVTGLSLVSTTTTVSNGSDRWEFQLRDVANSLDLFSAVQSTNGNDLTAHVRKDYTPNQNTVRPAGAVLRFAFTKFGSATTMAEVLVQLDGYTST